MEVSSLKAGIRYLIILKAVSTLENVLMLWEFLQLVHETP